MVAETILDKDTAGPTPSGWPTPLKGIEDIKLSMCDKQIWYTGTMCHEDKKIGCVYGLYDQTNMQGLNPIELNKINKEWEKNWVFIPNKNKQMVYKWNPLQIGQIEGSTFTIIKTSTDAQIIRDGERVHEWFPLS